MPTEMGGETSVGELSGRGRCSVEGICIGECPTPGQSTEPGAKS